MIESRRRWQLSRCHRPRNTAGTTSTRSRRKRGKRSGILRVRLRRKRERSSCRKLTLRRLIRPSRSPQSLALQRSRKKSRLKRVYLKSRRLRLRTPICKSKLSPWKKAWMQLPRRFQPCCRRRRSGLIPLFRRLMHWRPRWPVLHEQL